MQNTTNYNLNKPDGSDFAKIASLNENADIIDAKLKELEDNESVFVQHSNNQQIHVTQAKQNSWDAKIGPEGGGTIQNILNIAGEPVLAFKVQDVKSSAIHKGGDGNLYLAHSSSINGNDWDFSNAPLVITSGGTVLINGVDLKQSVSSGKTAIANATTQMGVPTDPNAEFATMAANILSINTGKKFATGVGAGATTMYSFRRAFNNETVSSYGLTVSGLDFKPGLILAFDAVSISMYQNYLSLDGAQTGGVITDFTTITAFGGGTQTAVNTLHGTGGDGYVNNGGFRIPIRSNTITVNWIAIE